MAEKVSYNLNDYCWVEITELGEEQYLKYFDNLTKDCPGLFIKPIPLEKNGGFVKLQLWQVFHYWGKHINNGFELPFNTTIYLEKNKIKE